MSMAIGQVNAWEQFNSAVNAARARTSVTPSSAETVAVKRELSDSAPLASKIYGSALTEKKAPQVVRGTLFDAYA